MLLIGLVSGIILSLVRKLSSLITLATIVFSILKITSGFKDFSQKQVRIENKTQCLELLLDLKSFPQTGPFNTSQTVAAVKHDYFDISGLVFWVP